MLEREVESAVVDYAEKKGCIVIKLNGPNDRGKPDRAFFYKNRVLIREVKRPGEEPTELQWKWINKFKAQGFDSSYFDTIGKGKTAVDNFIAKADRDSIYDDL